MGKTTRKAGKNAVNKQASTNEYDEIRQNYERELKSILERREAYADSVIRKMTQSMHFIISNLPPEVADMTVKDYVEEYMRSSEKQPVSSPPAENQPLKEIQNSEVTTSHPDLPSNAEGPPTTNTRSKRKKVNRKVPPSTRMTRSKKFETPAHPGARTPFVTMVEGTPMLTRQDINHLSLTTGKATRQLKSSDNEFSALGLTLYSKHGTPISVPVEGGEGEMHRHVQEAIQKFMEELR